MSELQTHSDVVCRLTLDKVHTTVQARADLTVAKDAPLTAIAGNGFYSTFMVSNNAPLTHVCVVIFSDSLPAHTGFHAFPTRRSSDLVVTCSRSVTLASGATTVFTIHVTVGAAVADGSDL